LQRGRRFESSSLFFDARQIGGVKRNKQMLHNSLFGDLRNKTSECAATASPHSDTGTRAIRSR
jgi:hypothetical protein